jgi:peptidoglycan/xylan/chitin deacetylase (PgdA/CDA1 family)
MITKTWRDVRRELDRWADQGLKARFWIRDDDACELSAQLSRLQALAHTYNVNIGLAVIPGSVRSDFIPWLLAANRAFFPMCHGWNHANYGRPGKPEEFGNGRPLAAVRRDAEQAYEVFSGHFGATNVVFVPPFGRIAPALIEDLPRIGFTALSTGPRRSERMMLRLDLRLPWTPAIRIPRPSGIPRFDIHVDVIDWTRRTARDRDAIAAELLANLRLRRRGMLPSSHPIGLLTHHLAHDEAIWRSCHELLDALCGHEAVEPLDADRLFRTAPQRPLVSAASLDAWPADAS